MTTMHGISNVHPSPSSWSLLEQVALQQRVREEEQQRARAEEAGEKWEPLPLSFSRPAAGGGGEGPAREFVPPRSVEEVPQLIPLLERFQVRTTLNSLVLTRVWEDIPDILVCLLGRRG